MLTTPGKSHLAQVAFGKNDTVKGTYYVGLLLTAPNVDGVTYSEPSGGSYARVEVINNSTNFSTATSGVVENLTVISFPSSTGIWGSVSYVGLFESMTAGTLLAYGSMNPNKYIGSGYDVNIPAGNLTITMRTTTE